MAIAHALTDTTADIASMLSSQSVTRPTSSDATHRLILIVVNEAGATPATTTISASGWTQIGTGLVSAAGGARQVRLYAFHGPGDVAPTLANSASGATHQQGYVCGAFTGVDTTTPIDVTGTVVSTGTGSANTLAVTGVTIATDQAWMLIAFGDWLGGIFSATGFTVSENGHTNASAGLLYNPTPKSTGATGNVTVNDSASSSGQSLIGLAFALRPAAAGGGGAVQQQLMLMGVGHSRAPDFKHDGQIRRATRDDMIRYEDFHRRARTRQPALR